MDQAPHYLGIDGCRGGWVGIIISDNAYLDAVKSEKVTELIADAQARARICVIGIDIPIGLPTSEPRPADIHAREALRPRGSTIFITPTAEALLLQNPEASQVNRRALGQGVSAQALSLGPRITEVAELLEDAPPPTGCPFVEVHPELSFAQMNHGDGHAQPVLHGKKTWTGMYDRLRLLKEAGIEIPPDASGAGNTTNPDDIIDAAAVAWTARRFHHGHAASYPTRTGKPTDWRVTDGNTATIWA